LDRQSLAQAFESFNHIAGSLEHSYSLLQAELSRLRQELQHKNADLAASLAENQNMRAYLACILEALPCGVVAADSNFELHFANPVARLLLSINTVQPAPTMIPATLLPLLKELTSLPAGTERTWQTSTLEGSVFVAVSCARMAGAPALQTEQVFILRDITEEKKLEEQRETTRRMKALAEMTAMLAHEVRNPLASMELFAGLIKDATLEHAEVSQWVVHLQAGLRVLSATVNNVLQYHSAAPPQLQPVAISKLVADTVEFLQPLALQRGMGIEFTPASQKIQIRAEAYQLKQVFFNLAMNAFRSMVSGKRLKVRVIPVLDEGSSKVRIEFEDEGSGIAPGVLSRIFDAGFTTAQGSPGLGLAVCKHIAGQHGAVLEAKSRPGQGSTFSLIFPVWSVQE